MNPTQAKRILIVAGEASGDLHGAKLVREIRQDNPLCSFVGIGGTQLAAAGMEIIVNSDQLAVVGLSEVLAHLSVILGALKEVKQAMLNQRPDLVILIDFPDFNFRVAKTAKKLGIKVLYYISPQLWAWRSGRIKTIKRYVDHMAVVFPFEVSLYQSKHVPVTFVGHPLTNSVASTLSISDARQAFNLQPHQYSIALIPGSRKAEIHRLLPVMLATAKLLKMKYPDIQFILPIAPSIAEDMLEPYLAQLDFEIKVVKQRIYDVMQACNAAITASGTVTLEAALMELPIVVIYKISWFSYQLAKLLINIPYISLTNIVAEQRVVPELIQAAANPEKIAGEIDKILQDTSYALRIKAELAKIKAKLLSNAGEQSIAKLALTMLD
ncbi:MAG: lpxB [Gammaproteobacteria bacterium]|jgi:lipid-A-disaccharide synthase|nr:lpxB [Gammaproteobacteria bacterium]